MTKHTVVVKEPIFRVLYEHRKGLFLGSLFWAFNAASGFFITVNASGYFNDMLDGNYKVSLIITCSLLILIVISMPFFGLIGERINNKKILITSILVGSALLMPISYYVGHSYLIGFTIAMAVFALVFSCNNALLSYITPELFPTRVRYTCVAVCFNICDTIVGGFTPFLVIYLTGITKHEGAVALILLLFAIISLVSYMFVKEKHPINYEK
jgi:MHS family proline/betaine transporter-like MFS transporter